MKQFDHSFQEEALFGPSIEDFLSSPGFLFTEQNIQTEPNLYTLRIEVPDFHKEELALSFEKDLLMLRGYKIDKIRSRFFTKKLKNLVFQRSFVCPEDIAPNTVKAFYSIGWLLIELPRQKISGELYGHYLPEYKRIPIKDINKPSFWQSLFFWK